MSIWFWKGKNLENTFKQILKFVSSVFDYDIINDSWFLMMNRYLAASFYRSHVLGKQKLIKADRTSHVGWPAPREGKVLWKTATKIKESMTENKVLCFKESFAFQNKCCILKMYYIKQKALFI